MLGVILLVLVFLAGAVLTTIFLPFLKKTPYFWGAAFFIGLWASGTLLFIFKLNFLLFGGMAFLFLFWQRKKLRFDLPGRGWRLVFLISFLFCWWFFSRTFASHDGVLYVTSNEYLDFGAHVPLIRSFSKGSNFPAELPFYAGEPIFYHFLFDFATACFEKTGWSIANAYNALSALSLSFIFVFIFYFSQELFAKKSKSLGALSVLLFLFAPDLFFINFFKKYPPGQWLAQLRNHSVYLNNGFSNIVVFANQRHLVFGIGLFLIFVLALRWLGRVKLEKKTIIFLGILLGLLPFWHSFVFLAVFIVGGIEALMTKHRRQLILVLLLALTIALPQILFIRRFTHNQILWHPGFLIHDDLSLFHWFKFWFYNFGAGLFLMIIGWRLAPRQARRFLTPILALFIVPNLFNFSREPFNDHKFFNLFILFGNLLTAWAVVVWWQKKPAAKLLVLPILALLLASGFLNLLVVKNDVWVSFADIPTDPFLQWIEKNTQPEAVFLTNLGIWDPVNLTGRKKFLGREHYLWAYGIDPSARMNAKKAILAGSTPPRAEQPDINFLAFNKNGEAFNKEFFEKYPRVYQDENWVVFAP